MYTNTRAVNFTAIINVLFFFLVSVAQVRAVPLAIRAALDVYNPKIIQPSVTTIWTAGAQEIVSWNTTDAPGSISNAGYVVLHNAGVKGVPEKRLAGPMDLKIGRVNVTVPKDLPSGTYRITLFGDSGNQSPDFWIHGVEPSPNSQPAQGSGDAAPTAGSDKPFGA